MNTIYLPELPNCALCDMEGATQTGRVRYDTPVAALGGRWGYLCHRHFGDQGNRALATKVKTMPGVRCPAEMAGFQCHKVTGHSGTHEAQDDDGDFAAWTRAHDYRCCELSPDDHTLGCPG